LFLAVVRAVAQNVPTVLVEEVTHPTSRKDATEEVGILTTSGDVVKNAEIVPEVKPSKKNKRFGG
jgi:hypothetical protein